MRQLNECVSVKLVHVTICISRLVRNVLLAGSEPDSSIRTRLPLLEDVYERELTPSCLILPFMSV